MENNRYRTGIPFLYQNFHRNSLSPEFRSLTGAQALCLAQVLCHAQVMRRAQVVQRAQVLWCAQVLWRA